MCDCDYDCDCVTVVVTEGLSEHVCVCAAYL